MATKPETAFDMSPAQLDHAELNFLGGVKELGFFITNVMAEDDLPGFSYTTGFWHNYRVPEVIIFGLDGDTCAQILWILHDHLSKGGEYAVGTKVGGILNDFAVQFQRVDKSHFAEHLGWSSWFYRGDQFECQQMVWPDSNDVFPWEDGFNESLRKQQPQLWVPD